MPSAARLVKKEVFAQKIFDMLDKYDAGFIVHADNVSSKQFMDIRRGIRDTSAVLMGKNTMVRRAFRVYAEKNNKPFWAELSKLLVGNVGIVFTTAPLADIKEEIAKYKVGAPAKAGSIAPVDVICPAGGTGLDPSQTNFFQALSIPTKINRGAVEIVSDVKVISEGDKVGASEAALLAKLNIKPFAYGLVLQHVFEKESIYDPKVLDITDDDLIASIQSAVNNISAVALETNVPTITSVPHLLTRSRRSWRTQRPSLPLLLLPPRPLPPRRRRRSPRRRSLMTTWDSPCSTKVVGRRRTPWRGRGTMARPTHTHLTFMNDMSSARELCVFS